jgi:hypothetical protein
MTQARDLADGKFDTNTLVVDAANNRVGVGTTSPAHSVEIVATSAGSVSDSLQIRNNATSTGTGSRIRFINSTDANSDANGASISSVRTGDDNALVFETENAERLRILAGGGLTFNGDTAAANALDDYEEGTWTPDIRNADNPNTFTTESGKYIKIGAVVVAYFINDGGNTGGGGGLQVNGLPFNTTNTAHIFGARGTAAVNNSSSTVRRNLIVNVNSGNSSGALLYYGGDFLSDTLTYASGFIIYQTDS